MVSCWPKCWMQGMTAILFQVLHFRDDPQKIDAASKIDESPSIGSSSPSGNGCRPTPMHMWRMLLSLRPAGLWWSWVTAKRQGFRCYVLSRSTQVIHSVFLTMFNNVTLPSLVGFWITILSLFVDIESSKKKNVSLQIRSSNKWTPLHKS